VDGAAPLAAWIFLHAFALCRGCSICSSWLWSTTLLNLLKPKKMIVPPLKHSDSGVSAEAERVSHRLVCKQSMQRAECVRPTCGCAAVKQSQVPLRQAKRRGQTALAITSVQCIQAIHTYELVGGATCKQRRSLVCTAACAC